MRPGARLHGGSAVVRICGFCLKSRKRPLMGFWEGLGGSEGSCWVSSPWAEGSWACHLILWGLVSYLQNGKAEGREEAGFETFSK